MFVKLRKIMLVFFTMALMSFAEDIETVTRAFELADTNFICEHFEELVGIKPPGEGYFRKHDKKQATVWLNTFYVEQGITGFVKTGVAENEGFTYIYGKLTNGRKRYTVTITMKLKDDKYRITSLRFT